MVRLEQIHPEQMLSGVTFEGQVTVVAVNWLGTEQLNVVFRGKHGLGERVLTRAEEARLELSSPVRPFTFEGDGADFRLAAEARRISLAHLFDPYLALTSAAIEPLPHQITAVYGEMLERQPLRYLLADDPGAGKTIMAGLLIKELMLRGDLRRCLIIAPGSLVDQWQDELEEKFGLSFTMITRELRNASYGGNPFKDHDRMICRLDMAARSDEMQALIEQSPDFDLIICDEAHRMSATHTGGEVKRTRRFLLGQRLATVTRHLLLMTATPHNGKDDDFHLFLSLLDADRFEGAHRGGVRAVRADDLMRRCVKEELYTFDGRPLFPERRAYTASYPLSNAEADLYAAVTEYVREEMNRVERFANVDGRRRTSVGFALQSLQRRLASSPRAIWRSLSRRRERLQHRLDEETMLGRRQQAREGADEHHVPDADELEELPDEELERLESEAIASASTASTVEELEHEIASLSGLERMALALCRSGEDAKWTELASILNAPPVFDEDAGRQRKILIFTEPRDTIDYLEDKIATHLGDTDAVRVIHGGVPRQQRRAIVAAFNDDPRVRVLLANDAAGEGVNLQRGAHLMVNYDLPWNPNKLEQRFGRIHRIGQSEVCHLWNLVAGETREGAVYERLLEKLEAARQQLGGKVFDVLGEAFEGRHLRDLLFEAVQYGDEPDVRQRLTEQVEGAVDPTRLAALTRRSRLAEETMDPEAVEALRHEMDRANARRLQPHYIQSFFTEAFRRAGGRIEPREPGRHEILHVPSAVRLNDHLIGRGDPVLERYERVTFEKARVRGAPGEPPASLIAPGHPLLDVLVEQIREHLDSVLQQGTVLVSSDPELTAPCLLALIQHAVHDEVLAPDGRPRTLSEEMHFVLLGEHGQALDAGPAPYLDMRPLREEERGHAAHLAEAGWLAGDLLGTVQEFAMSEIAAPHLERIRGRRLAHIDKIENEVRRRLTKDASYWARRAAHYAEEIRAGKDKTLARRQAEERAERSAERLEIRMSALARERAISGGAVNVRGGALVIPEALLQPEDSAVSGARATDTRAAELLGMEAVFAAERAAGRTPIDVSTAKLGWDIESTSRTGDILLIEVKAKRRGSPDLIVTKNEVIQAKNAAAQYHLAIVLHEDGRADPPLYVSDPGRFFDDVGAFGAEAHVYRVSKLLVHATPEPLIPERPYR